MINIIKQDILFLSMWLNISEMGGVLVQVSLMMQWYYYYTVLYYWCTIMQCSIVQCSIIDVKFS